MTTFPDKDMAKSIAKLLVEKHLAACVQILPIESVYIWQDKVYDETEIILFIKSKMELFDKIATAIRESHTYEVPEIIQVPITGGIPEYVKWIEDWVE